MSSNLDNQYLFIWPWTYYQPRLGHIQEHFQFPKYLVPFSIFIDYLMWISFRQNGVYATQFNRPWKMQSIGRICSLECSDWLGCATRRPTDPLKVTFSTSQFVVIVVHSPRWLALLADHGCCDDDPSIGGLFNTLHSNLLSIEFLLSSSSSTSFFHQIEFDFLTSLSCCG